MSVTFETIKRFLGPIDTTITEKLLRAAAVVIDALLASLFLSSTLLLFCIRRATLEAGSCSYPSLLFLNLVGNACVEIDDTF